MRPVLPLGALLLALAALLFGWRALTKPPDPRTESAPRHEGGPASTTPATEVPRVTRDLLRYEQPQPAATSRPPRQEPVAAPSAAQVAAPSAERLVGFVRRRGSLCAAVVLPGNATVVALAAGESELGYTVLTVDEELGARLRLPDGSELLLPPPQ